MNDNPAEALNELDSARAEAHAELEHLRDELSLLTRRRQEATERVMCDNSDQAAQALMRETETKIESLKEAIATFRKEAYARLSARRLEIEAKRNARLEELERELASLRAEQETLKGELIPRAQAALDDYQEQKKACAAKMLTLMSRINVMRRQQVDSSLIEID